MDIDKKKLVYEYKQSQEKKLGGICCIRNKESKKVLLTAEPDIAGAKNRFAFSVKVDNPVNYAIKEDWKIYGKDSFTFEILETLEKKPEEDARTFRENLKKLLEIYQEKFIQNGESLY